MIKNIVNGHESRTPTLRLLPYDQTGSLSGHSNNSAHVPSPDALQDAISQGLMRLGAYPLPLPDVMEQPGVNEGIPGRVIVRRTHGSVVFLVGDRAYKLKRSVILPYLNYSTPERRQFYCAEEVRVNAPLAPHVYLGVAPVLAYSNGEMRCGPSFPPSETPAFGTSCFGGLVVDYAVVMVRLPESATCAAKLAAGKLTRQEIASVAQRIAHFHCKSNGKLASSQSHHHMRNLEVGEAAATARGISSTMAAFGDPAVIAGNWEETSRVMEQIAPSLLPVESRLRIGTYMHDFIRHNWRLFRSRIARGWIRPGHGDLRLEHCYLYDPLQSWERDPTGPQVTIIDAIEFGPQYRYLDVAADIAFFMMELDAAGAGDLADHFLDTYITTLHQGTESVKSTHPIRRDHSTNLVDAQVITDQAAVTPQDATDAIAIRRLLPFYGCYRACIRGTIAMLRTQDEHQTAEDRLLASEEAQRLFALALRYAAGYRHPASGSFPTRDRLPHPSNHAENLARILGTFSRSAH